MGARIITDGGRVERFTYHRSFAWVRGHGGFSFPCSPLGDIDFTQMHPEGLASLALCRDKVQTGEIIDEGVKTYVSRYREPRVIECHCGYHLALYDDTQCPQCERYYNVFGQELNPPHMWEEPWDED